MKPLRIIDRETFELFQLILEMKDKHKSATQYPFYGFLVCPFCGEKMISVTLPSRLHEQAYLTISVSDYIMS